jgi:hypothetical protein
METKTYLNFTYIQNGSMINFGHSMGHIDKDDNEATKLIKINKAYIHELTYLRKKGLEDIYKLKKLWDSETDEVLKSGFEKLYFDCGRKYSRLRELERPDICYKYSKEFGHELGIQNGDVYEIYKIY